MQSNQTKIFFLSLHLLWWKQGPVQSTFAEYNYYFTICTHLENGASPVPPVQNVFGNKILETCNATSLPLEEIIFGWSHHRPKVKKKKCHEKQCLCWLLGLLFQRWSHSINVCFKASAVDRSTHQYRLGHVTENGIEFFSAARDVHSTMDVK